MVWEKIGRGYHVCGPWLVKRYGFGVFLLLRNGREVSRHPTMVAAKLAAKAYLDEGS